MSSGLWFVFGVAAGILLPLLASIIKHFIMKPDIVIQEDVPMKGSDYIYHSIRIENKGRTVAKSCHGLLTIENMEQYEVLQPPGHAYVSKNNYRTVKDESLCWALQIRSPANTPVNPVFLSISPKSSRLLELCHTGKASEIIFPSEMGWEIIRVALLADKEYEIEIKIFAENVQYNPRKHSKKFKLIPDVKTSELAVEPK